jgi:spore maturation protein SpmB
MLVAIGVLRNSGVLGLVVSGLAWLFELLGFNTDFTPALPTALMKPISGSGARAMMVDAMKTYGADSFVGRLACIFQGSADTTFYIVALYFGSVGINKTRYSIPYGLLGDLAGVIAAIGVAYLFFHWGTSFSRRRESRRRSAARECRRIYKWLRAFPSFANRTTMMKLP